MPVCGTISANIALSCASPIVGGLGDKIYLANYEQWQGWAIAVSGGNSLAITDITPDTGQFIYSVENYTNKVRSMYERVDAGGRTMYKHSVTFEVAKDDAASTLAVKGIGQGRFVAIVVSNSGQIRVYGAGSGLTAAAGAEQDYYANQGAYTFTLASNDETPEATPAKHFVGSSTVYDFQTAKAELEALVAA